MNNWHGHQISAKQNCGQARQAPRQQLHGAACALCFSVDYMPRPFNIQKTLFSVDKHLTVQYRVSYSLLAGPIKTSPVGSSQMPNRDLGPNTTSGTVTFAKLALVAISGTCWSNRVVTRLDYFDTHVHTRLINSSCDDWQPTVLATDQQS